ncbi:MAG: hypothetical protein AAGK26_09265, partial [Pseudomonadota bacterium]
MRVTHLNMGRDFGKRGFRLRRPYLEQEEEQGVYPAIQSLISLGGTQPGWRGFSSYGHRLGSLYRMTNETGLVL